MKTIARDYLGRLLIGEHLINSFDVVPNTFEDMYAMIDNNGIKFRLFNIKSPTIKPDETIECTAKNIYTEDAFLLVFGGWIPCSLIKNNTIIIADRNIINEITNRYKNGKKKKNDPLDALDGIFLQGNHSIDITVFVIEGNKKKIPENSDIDEQVIEITNKLKSALPNLKIAKYPNGNGYYYAIRDFLSGMINKRMAFLKDVAPKLNKQFTEKSREVAANHIFESAKRINLEKNDISIILALLRITMLGKKTAAQLVLKDSQIYTEENAYNAACDLAAIELLINLHNFHIKNNSTFNIAFMTKDKGLSLFNSLFANTKVTSSDGAKLTVTAQLNFSIFGDDHEIIQKYNDWFTGKI